MILRLHHIILACFALASLFSCKSAPPSAIRTSIGEVRAATEAEAKSVADTSAFLRAQLLELIPGSRPAGADVWVYPDEEFGDMHENSGIAGLVRWSFPGHFLGGKARIELPRRSMEHSLAHEWVHLLLGPSWRSLTGAMEEGLANELASQLTHPRERAKLRFGYLCAALQVPWPEERFTFRARNGKKIKVRRKVREADPLGPDLTLLEVLSQPKIRKKSKAKRPGSLRLYGLGTLLAERIAAQPEGLARLHAACAETRSGESVSPQALIELAGFDSADEFEVWLWREHLAATPGAFFTQTEAFASLVAELERMTERELDLGTVLDEMEPTYKIGASEVFRIADDEGLRRLFSENWPAREEIDAIKTMRDEQKAQEAEVN